jgi:hypothetical protein
MQGPLVEGHILIDDENLRHMITTLTPGESLLLKGDKADILKPQDTIQTNKELLTQFLSCLIIPDPHGSILKIQYPHNQQTASSPKKFIAIFLLYKNEKDKYEV